MDDIKYICPTCGEIEPTQVYDSFPSQGVCPNCKKMVSSNQKFNFLSEEEARKLRPEFYKKYDLAKRIAERIQKEWTIGTFSRFCDEPADFDSVKDEDLIRAIMEVL